MDKSRQVEFPLKFDTHPSVVFRLGEELISDVVQALLELAKNSYDADADYAKITIQTTGPNMAEGSAFPQALGSIVVEDNGTGMDLEVIRKGWLLISSLAKRKMKNEGKTTIRGRTPLGDKGLGRLGAQRLGRNLEIFTKTERADELLHVYFSWDDFLDVEKLSDVEIRLEKLPPQKKKGSRIVISNLKEIEVWQGDIVKRLEGELSKVLSPYREVRGFTVDVEVNGKKLELVEFSDKLRNAAQVRYKLNFDGITFKVRGKAKLDFFRPQNSSDWPEFAALVEGDDGKEFLEFLAKQKQALRYALQRSNDPGWFVEFTYERQFSGLDNLALIKEEPANPGVFVGEVDGFDLGIGGSFKRQNVFDRMAQYRLYINQHRGIRVYRDGFGIRVDDDWLRLGGQWSDATSYYGLKPNTTLGYIALTARENMQLEETTDREGFKASPFYDNFYELLSGFKKFTMDAHEFLRRGWLKFREKHHEKLANIDKPAEPEELTRKIKSGLAKASSHRKALVATSSRPEPNTTLNVTGKDHVPGIIEYLDELSGMEAISQVLIDHISGLKQQIADMFETVALGLTAEALSHEIFQIADQLAQRTAKLKAHLKRKSIIDPPVIAFSEHVNTSVNALRKQVAHLSPSLRYVREKREQLRMSQFLASVVKEYYRDKLTKKNIEIEILTQEQKDFAVYMNKGKLTQVFDNLILNSEYWLSEDIRRKRMEDGKISIEIKRPFVLVRDNGRGIEKSIETTIFEPFVTDKGREKGQEKGRGLGLFIIRQLLDSEGCHITLLPHRNEQGRLYIFQIDLRGALDGNV
jgi:hypothetical protein